MSSKAVQKRQNTKPKAGERSVADPGSYVSRLSTQVPDKIVGFSWKGIILCSVLGMMAFNVYLLKQMNSMRGEMQELSSNNAQEVKIILDQKLNPNTLETSYFNNKIEGMREEILKKISNIKTQTKVETIVEREPASKFINTESAIKRMGYIDVQKYNVQNLRAFPKYHNFLSEQSQRQRELRGELTDIVDNFVTSHDILRRDRAEYHRVLAFRDSVQNAHIDAQKISNQKWKRIHIP